MIRNEGETAVHWFRVFIMASWAIIERDELFNKVNQNGSLDGLKHGIRRFGAPASWSSDDAVFENNFVNKICWKLQVENLAS